MATGYIITDEIDRSRSKLEHANANNRSIARRLSLWSDFIRIRDARRCLNCGSHIDIQAHHIFRKITYPLGSLEFGNGITLCRNCHRKIHAAFNRRPAPFAPLNSQEGDDQDEMSFLYGLLINDAKARGLDQERYYYISDDMLLMFVRYQGYPDYFDSMSQGNMSRIRLAHEIWRGMPDQWYTNIAEDFGKIFLHSRLGDA